MVNKSIVLAHNDNEIRILNSHGSEIGPSPGDDCSPHQLSKPLQLLKNSLHIHKELLLKVQTPSVCGNGGQTERSKKSLLLFCCQGSPLSVTREWEGRLWLTGLRVCVPCVTDRESATGVSCCALWTWSRAPSQWETPTTQQGDLGDKVLPHLHWVEMWYTSPVACYSFFLGHCSTYRRKWQSEPLTFQVSIFKSVYAGKALCFIATMLTWLTCNLNVPAARWICLPCERNVRNRTSES